MEVGTRVGAFELSEKLSEGYESQLWRAVHAEGDGPQVVIRLSGDERPTERVREEYEILRQLDDPRILKPVAFVDDQRAVVLEHVDGVSLEEVLEAARQHLVNVNLGSAVDLGLEIANALRAAHQLVRARGRIVHGHLSPDRVMLTRQGEVKLLGLGAPPAPRPFPYQPPEIALRLPFDARTDQWLTAALICELAAVSLPERSVTRGAKPDLHLPPTLAENLARIGRVSPHLAEVLSTALSASPKQRFSPETVFLRELYVVSRSLRQPTHRHELASLVAAHRARLRPGTDAPLIPSLRERTSVEAPTLDMDEGLPRGQWARTDPSLTDPGVPLRIPPDLPPIGDELEYTDPLIDPEESDEDAFSFATWLREKQGDSVDTFDEDEEDTSSVPYFEFTPLTNYVRPDTPPLAELESRVPVVDDAFLSWSRRAAFFSMVMMFAAIAALVAMRAGLF